MTLEEMKLVISKTKEYYPKASSLTNRELRTICRLMKFSSVYQLENYLK